MESSNKMELPTTVLPVTRTASILGILQSFLWIALCAVAMASYNNCSLMNETPTNADRFSLVLQHQFFLSDNCTERSDSDFTPITIDGVVRASHVFTWVAVAVSFSSVWFIASIVLLFYVAENTIKTINMVIYTWCILTLAVTVVDLTLGVLFGMSFQSLSNNMNVNATVLNDNTNYIHDLDLARLGAMMLMTVSLKGFIMILINLMLVVLLFKQAVEINRSIVRGEHSIHNRNPIDAFAGPKEMNEVWLSPSSEYDQPMERPPINVNRAYRSDMDREREREREREDRNAWQNNMDRNNGYREPNPSNSWRQPDASNMSARPFSYLEEPRSSRPPATPPVPVAGGAMNPPWRRAPNWDPVPPVPAPDYSPVQNRKLKSALKPGYY